MDQFTAYQQLQNMGGNGYHLQQFGGLDARSGQAQQMQHGQQDLNQLMLLQQLQQQFANQSQNPHLNPQTWGNNNNGHDNGQGTNLNHPGLFYPYQ